MSLYRNGNVQPLTLPSVSFNTKVFMLSNNTNMFSLASQYVLLQIHSKLTDMSFLMNYFHHTILTQISTVGLHCLLKIHSHHSIKQSQNYSSHFTLLLKRTLSFDHVPISFLKLISTPIFFCLHNFSFLLLKLTATISFSNRYAKNTNDIVSDFCH